MNETLSDDKLIKFKIRVTLKKVFKTYMQKKTILLESVVDKMLETNYGGSSGGGGKPTDKLSKFSDSKIDAEKYVKVIDGMLDKLDGRSKYIIESIYIDGKSNPEIYNDPDNEVYKLYLSERQYFRVKNTAEQKMYRIFIKNYEFLEKWQ